MLAVGGSSLLLTLALTPAAVAAATASRGAAGAVGTAGGIPNTKIEGKHAHWSPRSLHAKARWTTPPTCTSAQESFTITNRESKAEKVKFTGTGHFTPFSGTIPGHEMTGVCITKGYGGTLTGKLKDGKKLKVHF